MSEDEEQQEEENPEEDEPDQGEPEPEQEFTPVNMDERSTHVIGEPRDYKSRIRTRLMFLLVEERKFKYFIILVAFLVVFGTTFTLKIQERLALAISVALLIYMLWIHVIIPEEKPMVKEGFVVTWKDKYGHLPFVAREHNLKLVYCQFAVYPNGSVESIPETEFLGAYTPDARNHIKFNPLIDMGMKKHLEKVHRQPIPYADGTDKYYSPLYVPHRRVSKAIQSGTPMAVKKTTAWLHGGES